MAGLSGLPLSRRQALRLLGGGLAGGLSAPLLAAACAGGQAAPGRRTVRYALATEPDTLNPALSSVAAAGTVMSLVMVGLLRLMPDGSFGGGLAQSYQVMDGGMTYRFALRPGLVWEDGHPVTARDFAFTWRTYMDPATRAVTQAGWEDVDQVETPDDRTIVVHMKRVFATFPLHVGCSLVLPEHVLTGAGDLSKAPFNRQPVGCGPFRVTRWDAASQIVLTANERFYRGRPRLQELVFPIVPDPATQLNQLRAGEVDIVTPTGDLWSQARALGPAVSTLAYDGLTYVMTQYVEYDHLKDVNVRQALDTATPKQSIVRDLLRGLATVAYGDVPPTSPYSNPHVEHHDYDPARARDLLRRAGFTTVSGVQQRGGRPLSVPIYTISTRPTYVQLAQVLEQSWRAIGVQTEMVTMDQPILFSQQGPLWQGRDVALVYGWGQGSDPYDYVNWSSRQIPADENAPGENLGRYANAEMDDLVVRGGETVDLAARKRIYDRVQEILAHDVPATFLYWPQTLYAYASWLQGFRPTAFSGPLWNVETWS